MRRTEHWNPLKWPIEKATALIAFAGSIGAFSAVVYEMSYFAALRISLRAIPLTFGDYSTEFFRVTPVLAVVMLLGYVAFGTVKVSLPKRPRMDWVNKRVDRLQSVLKNGPHYSARQAERKLERIYHRFLKPLNKLEKAHIRYFTLCSMAVLLPICICMVAGPALSSDYGTPYYGVCALLIAGGVGVLGSWIFIFALPKGRLYPSITLVASALFMIHAWGAFNALTSYSNVQRAEICTSAKVLAVNIIGSYEKGVLIKEERGPRFIFWSELKAIKYFSGSDADILEPWLQGLKARHPNPLRDNTLSKGAASIPVTSPHPTCR